MKDDFMIEIKTWHKPDLGTLENVSKSNVWIPNYSFRSLCWAVLPLLPQVHQLDEQTQKDVEVVPIDIANKDEVAPGVS